MFEAKTFTPIDMGADDSSASAPAVSTRVTADDKTMLKAAAQLTRDLNRPDARIYWVDLIVTVMLGYAALAGAILAPETWQQLVCAIVSTLAIYRAGSFIHELAHIKKGDLPGFRRVWNLMVGIPMFAPSFMYEGVHNQHHAKTKYGTIDDPEYLPLASMRWWSLPLFMFFGTIAPVLLFVRFALLAPLSFFSKRLRKQVVEKYSGLQINPDFRRAWPKGEEADRFTFQEVGGVVWTWSLLAAMATGALPLSAFAIFMAIACGMMALNQLRTLVAHAWDNDERLPMTVTAQYLDSVNVPPPATLPALWAPVGLRYHALHHLLPGVPYHNLGKAHARLCAELDADSNYHKTASSGLFPLVWRLSRATIGRRTA